MNDMLARMKELNDQLPESAESDENPMDVLNWCVDQSIDALTEIKLYAECGNASLCATMAIKATSHIKQLYIKYLEQCKIMAALRGNLDLANTSAGDFYTTYADDIDIDDIQDAPEDDEDDPFLSAIGSAMAADEDKKEDFDNAQYLTGSIKRAILSLGEIELMAQYGRPSECAREAVDTIDRINVLRGKFNEATKIVFEV